MSSPEKPHDEASGRGATDHLDTVIALHTKAEHSLDEHQRFVERVVARIGRPRTLYTLVGIVVAWGLLNEAMPRLAGLEPVDEPPFFWAQGALALYAALVSTMVLTAQNRSQRVSQQRAYLQLEINLLAEQKTTKLIALVEELRRDLPNVRDRVDAEADLMSKTVDPHAVLNALEETIRSTMPPPIGVELPLAASNDEPE